MDSMLHLWFDCVSDFLSYGECGSGFGYVYDVGECLVSYHG